MIDLFGLFISDDRNTMKFRMSGSSITVFSLLVSCLACSALAHGDTANRVPLKSAKERRQRWGTSSDEESSKRKAERSRRIKERRERAKERIRNLKPQSEVERMTPEELDRIGNRLLEEDPNLERPANQWLRRAGWSSGSVSQDPYTINNLANPGEEYDWWAQAYRMLGGFIDCDTDKGGNSHSGDKNEGGNGCSRWMMWAAYVNPEYQGGGREEYFGDYGEGDFYNAGEGEKQQLSALDCHSPETKWQLLGVYRQEFYQFVEQISKHVWAIDEYEYIIALAGLAYMTDEDCWNVGYDENGGYLYAGVQPTKRGEFYMALYSDADCLTLNKETKYTYDDFAEITEMDLGSKDAGNIWGDDAYYQNSEAYQQAVSDWTAAQTYTLDLINQVYTEYKYCTLCLDYPTYQDGYFIGDDGTDEDDLINQCWKFHSHDSFPCEADCIALGAAQGSIVQLKFGDRYYGNAWDGSSGSGASTTYDRVGRSYYSSSSETKLDKLKANLFVCASGILFVATFLAFAVARGSGSRDKKDSKSRSLLTDDERRSRSKSKERRSRDRHAKKSKSRERKDRDSKLRRSKSRSSRGKQKIVDDF